MLDSLSKKISYIMEKRGYAQKDIALQLSVSPTTINHKLKETDNKKITDTDALAILHIMELPKEILKLSNKDKIDNYLLENKDIILRNRLSQDDLLIMKQLIGEWFIYGYSTDKNRSENSIFYEYNIKIDDNLKVEYTLHEYDKGVGAILCRKNSIILILHFNQRDGYDEICIFRKEKIIKEIFLAPYVSASFSLFNPLVGFSIMSKQPLKEEEINQILDEQKNNQVEFNPKYFSEIENIRLKYI